MDRVKGIAAALAAVAALGVGGAAIASATGGGDSSSTAAESPDAKEGPDQAIGGSDLDKASAAALQHTGGGQVSDTEVGDEGAHVGTGAAVDLDLQHLTAVGVTSFADDVEAVDMNQSWHPLDFDSLAGEVV